MLREEGWKKGRGEKHQLVAFHILPEWGSNLQLRLMPWPGMKPGTLWYMDDAQPAEPFWPGSDVFFSYLRGLWAFIEIMYTQTLQK